MGTNITLNGRTYNNVSKLRVKDINGEDVLFNLRQTSAYLSENYLKLINDAGEDVGLFTSLRFTADSYYINGATEICNVGKTSSDYIKAYKNGTDLIIYSPSVIKGFDYIVELDSDNEKFILKSLSLYEVRSLIGEQLEYYCIYGIINLYFDNFDTSNVTNMSNMFRGCISLTNLDLSNFDTSNVTDMSNMFDSCPSLTNLDLSTFNTSNVTNMNSMFYNCKSLTSLDLSSFNTSNVTDMRFMFYRWRSLQSLDLSTFNTSNVTNMNDMFSECTSLTSLDLSNFDISNVIDVSWMFDNDTSLQIIYVQADTDWADGIVENSVYMFRDCTSLPNFDSSKIDIQGAKLVENGGYFTLKN